MFQTNQYVLQAVSLVLLYEQKDTDGLAFKLKAFLMYVVIAERVAFCILYSCPTFFIPNRADDKLKCNTTLLLQPVRQKKTVFHKQTYSASFRGSRREAI